ncbi:hypothetical protein [Paenibacillus sp. FSL H3-0333]|uniref:hypothetical protein n=1 Tax=Paenibacillus sp. FSL H3-0333 TaxID=2921373 RepID=UPI0030F5E8B4
MAIRMKLNTILGEIEIDTYRNYTHVIVTKGEYLSRNYHLFDDSNWSKYENIEYRSGEKQAAGLKRTYDSGKTSKGGHFRGVCEIHQLEPELE